MNAAATSTRTITAFFEERQDAVEAIQRLENEGIPRADINILEGSKAGTGAATAGTSHETGGFGKR